MSDRIEARKGVCGGAPCVRGTRIPVWLLARYRDLGMPIEEVMIDYPSLSSDDIQAAWEFDGNKRLARSAESE